VGHRAFKQRIYPQFARLGQALASDRRLELLDLLAQAPRHVDALAAEAGMSLANVSQHLQVLRAAHLVESERDGTKVVYHLAGDDVLRLWLSLRSVAAARLPEVPLIARQFAVPGAAGSPLLDRPDLLARLARDEVTLIDVRPPVEFESGHLPGAICMPLDELPEHIAELPRDRPVVAYCRGTYCLSADEAVALLASHGFEAYRLDGGWPEWVAADLPTNTREGDVPASIG
jgi:rhodanese-related sulfurtransferase/DNA-binding transcriptional ArsR family regulator